MPASTTADLDSFNFCCCDVRISVTFDSSVNAELIRTLLPPGAEISFRQHSDHRFKLWSCGTEGYSVQHLSHRRWPTQELPAALARLRKSFQHCVAEYSRERVFVHAGVVEWNGTVIVCPGRSFAGKSTLVSALVLEGARYYSDEYAVFDSDGRVHPFLIPIRLRSKGGTREEIVATEVGLQPLPPNVLLFARYRPNRVWTPKKLSAADTVLALLKHSISMRRNPERVLAILSDVARNTIAYRGERNDTGSVKNWLRGLDI